MATTSYTDYLLDRARIRWPKYGDIRGRIRICCLGRDTRWRSDAAGHGSNKLVADWAAEVQERDSWALGSSEASHPAALGLDTIQKKGI